MNSPIKTATSFETARTYAPPSSARVSAQAALWLQRAVQLWFAVAVIGQWLFSWYILATYWAPAGRGESERWNNLFTGDNFAFMAHVGLALGIFVAGPLQLIPQIRAQFPRFHRWNGRVYLLSVAIASSAGLYLIWFYSDVVGVGVKIGTSISAGLALYFGWQAVRFAIARNFAAHRRYALRLFITALSVWFFRIQLMLWMMLSGGKGLDPETFQGPALVITSFTQYLIPLLVLEIYFAVQKSNSARTQWLCSAGLLVLTLLMCLGLYATFMGMWLPKI